VAGRAQVVRVPLSPPFGSAGSLFAGLRAIGTEDVLVLDCDLLFHPNLLERFLLERPCAALVDPDSPRYPQVLLADGRVVSMGDFRGNGFYMGRMLMSAEMAHAAVGLLAQHYQHEYWVALGPLYGDFYVTPLGVARYPAVNIDTQAHSLYAHRDVFPLVLEGLGIQEVKDADL